MSQKVSLYSVNDLKNATDDALAPYLTKLPKPYTFTQSHRLANVRLLLGYTAVVIAGALFYIDWKQGWDVTKPYTLPACVIYFLLNGALSYWIWGVERGTVFVGVREGGQKLTLRSSTQKHKPTYTLKIVFEPSSRSVKWEDKEITGRFTDWFDKDGYLQHDRLKAWLARNIEVVGRADPGSKGAVFDGTKNETGRREGEPGPALDETQMASLSYAATAGAGGDAQGTGKERVDETPSKARKGRRKA